MPATHVWDVLTHQALHGVARKWDQTSARTPTFHELAVVVEQAELLQPVLLLRSESWLAGPHARTANVRTHSPGRQPAHSQKVTSRPQQPAVDSRANLNIEMSREGLAQAGPGTDGDASAARTGESSLCLLRFCYSSSERGRTRAADGHQLDHASAVDNDSGARGAEASADVGANSDNVAALAVASPAVQDVTAEMRFQPLSDDELDWRGKAKVLRGSLLCISIGVPGVPAVEIRVGERLAPADAKAMWPVSLTSDQATHVRVDGLVRPVTEARVLLLLTLVSSADTQVVSTERHKPTTSTVRGELPEGYSAHCDRVYQRAAAAEASGKEQVSKKKKARRGDVVVASATSGAASSLLEPSMSRQQATHNVAMVESVAALSKRLTELQEQVV